jgi:hypothetical protein
MSGSALTGNLAQGGIGGSKGNGGDGLGGALALLVGSASISNSTLDYNSALGGNGGAGGNGDSGFGGALYAASGTVVTLCSDTVEFNSAGGGSGSIAGQGSGGGLYIESGATAYLDAFTVANTKDNMADIDANIDGTYILQSC